MAKEIKLTHNKTTIVDDEDFEYYNQFKWFYKDNGYAYRNVKDNCNKIKIVRLHRLINKTPPEKFTDHINGNKLDNRKCNLRTCTRTENNRNIGLSKDNTSGYKGVSWFKRDKKWRATIVVDCKQIHLGYFDNKQDAAEAYNKAAILYHGKFAQLNSIGITHHDKKQNT